MKTELRSRPHSILIGQNVFEVWYENQFIATVTGADGPGVRVISRHTMRTGDEEWIPPFNCTEVVIELVPEQQSQG